MKRPQESAGAAAAVGDDGLPVWVQKKKRIRRRNNLSKGERETIEEEKELHETRAKEAVERIAIELQATKNCQKMNRGGANLYLADGDTKFTKGPEGVRRKAKVE